MEGLELTSGFWKDRRVLVTGATGLVGGWLTRRLVDRGAEVACLVRDWVPQSELLRSGTMARVNVVRGDVCDRDTVERAIGEYETGVVIHLAAQTIVGIANRNPVSTFESNIRGTWTLLEACRRSPGVRSIVVAPAAKGQGAGGRILGALIEEAEGHGVQSVCLFTRIPDFFFKYGFRTVEDKSELPDKIFKDCQNCPRLHRCDEVAMVRVLHDVPVIKMQQAPPTPRGVSIPVLEETVED